MPDADPRVTLSEWLEASPFDSAAEMIRSREFKEAIDNHPEDGPDTVVVAEADAAEYDAATPGALAESGFETMPVKKGTLRMEIGGADVAVSVPDGDGPAVLCWKRKESRTDGQRGAQG
jgi:hypothetical protein